jgi:hypothetical protein
MPAAASRQWLTVGEVARVASHLTGRSCSTRQVRHLLVTGGLGTDAKRRTHGQTRLYGSLDVAFVRLALRLERDGVSPWVARVVLTYLRNDLIRAWKASAPVALAIDGLKGSLEPALKSRPASAAVWVPLRDVWRGIDTEIERACDARDTVWMWRKVSVHAVPRAAV